MRVRLDYVKRERSPDTCIFIDSCITWASVALRFGSSSLGTNVDRLWLSVQTHTHTSNCCASAHGEIWARFQFLPTRQSWKGALVPVRSRRKWGTHVENVLGDVQTCYCCMLFMCPLLTSHQLWMCHFSISVMAARIGSKVTGVERAHRVCVFATLGNEWLLHLR